MKSVASTETQPCLDLVYFSARRVSINFAPRIMARERWHLYGCVIVSCRMRGVGLRNSARASVSGLRLTFTCLGCWRNGFKRPVLKHGPRSPTRPRVFGWKTRARNESKSWDLCRGGHRRPDQTFCDGSAVERACWDPKDGELCLNRVKPEETLVEARSDSDVQIDRQIWV